MSQQRYEYPHVEIDLGKLKENLAALQERCQASSIELCGVVKGFHALPRAAKVYEQAGVSSIASSRLDQLRRLKEAGIRAPLMLIRIPMPCEAQEAVRWSDISLNSEISVLRLLNEAARSQGKIHQVILMVDLGDLREGFWDWDELVSAALEVERDLPGLHLLGVGVNLGCYGSVQATPEKMRDLVEAAERVEAAIGRTLEVISGGASSSLHMVLDGTMPPRVNHLRVGEGILLGGVWGCNMEFMHKDVFTLRAQVIESKVKPSHPVGELSVDAFGRTRTYVDRGRRLRCLLAMGRVDYGESDDLIPREPGIKVLGASSDHTILDVEGAVRRLRVGDVLEFDLCYATMVYLTGSPSVHIYYQDET